jgi:hypothetical protein
MSSTFTDSDEGKIVVDTHDQRIGIISEVRDGTAFITPNAGIGERIKSKLGWGSITEESYPLMNEAVETITDEEIRIRRD